MSSGCNNPTLCPGGNCIGCQAGMPWANDPRCQPYCPGFALPPDHDHVALIIVVIIIICVALILFVVWYVYGPTWTERHNNSRRANVLQPSVSTPAAVPAAVVVA